MSALVRLPRTLLDVTRLRDVDVDSGTVGAVLQQLASRWPVLGRRLCDETGALRRYVNVYVDGVDVRTTGGLATAVPDGSRMEILPSVAGG